MRRPVLLLALVVAGGCAQTPPSPGEVWSEIALPEGERRLEASVAARGTDLIVAAGYETTESITAEVLALDTLDGTWTELPSFELRWTHVQLAGHGGTVYALGGLEGTELRPSSQAFVLPPGADAWEPLPALPAPRGAAAVLVSPPTVFLIGGNDNMGPTSTTLAFDLITRTWSEGALPPLPTPRSHAAVVEQRDGSIVVAGGLGTFGVALGDVWRLRPGDTQWQAVEPMPTRRGGCASGSAFGSLVCAGGEADGRVLDTVDRLDLTVDTWTALPAMPAPRTGTSGAVIGGTLYVVGGTATFGLQPTDTVFALRIIDALDE